MDQLFAAMGHQSNPQIHDYLRHGEFDIRFSHLRGAAACSSCNANAIQDWMVYRIRHLGVIDCARHSKQKAVLQEPAGEISAYYNIVNFCRNADNAIHTGRGDFRVQPAAHAFSSVHRTHCIVLHFHRGDHEDGVL